MTDAAARAELLADVEDEIEAWLCALDREWLAILADARLEAERLVREAEARAAALVEEAEADARTILAGAGKVAAQRLADAESEATRARTLAAESNETARAIAAAADATVSGRVHVDDLAALGEAVERLRVELSRVVDAAFDALPAVEATAAALRAEVGEPVIVEPARPRGLFRRMLRR